MDDISGMDIAADSGGSINFVPTAQEGLGFLTDAAQKVTNFYLDFQRARGSIENAKLAADTNAFVANTQATISRTKAISDATTELNRSQIQLAQAQALIKPSTGSITTLSSNPGQFNMLLILGVVAIGALILAKGKF